jgi:hypothetical protein
MKRRPLFCINTKNKELYYNNRVSSIDCLRSFIYRSYFQDKYTNNDIWLKCRENISKYFLIKIINEIVTGYLSVIEVKSQNIFNQGISHLKQNQLDSLKETFPLNIVYLNRKFPNALPQAPPPQIITD